MRTNDKRAYIMYIHNYIYNYNYVLGSALASLSVEARIYFLNKPNLQKLFPKSTLSWETI